MLVDVKMDTCTMYKLLCDRVSWWVDGGSMDGDTANLFEKMYDRQTDDGYVWSEFDPIKIVDNDWINYCVVLDESDKRFTEVKDYYKKGELDMNQHPHLNLGWIESVDDETDPSRILIRC